MTEALKRGLQAGSSIVPTFIAIFIGFGIASRVTDAPVWAALIMTAAVFAAPAQLVMLDLAGHGTAALAQVVIAGILVNLRFLLMSLTLAHLFPRLPRHHRLLAAQFVSASSYLLTFFQSRRRQDVNLYDFYRGVVLMSFPAAVIGTAIGTWFGTGLPAVLAFGASLFLPVYFALLLAGDVRGRSEITAVLLGFLLTPPMEFAMPGWGLFVTAVGVGAVVTVTER